MICLLKFCQEIKFSFWWNYLLISEPLFSLILWSVHPKWKPFKNIGGLFYPLKKNISFISGFICIIISSELYFLKKDLSWVSELYLHYNPFRKFLKISTKIWGCHVMFPHHFYAKISFGHWRFWALHQIFKSGPVGIFALQPI